MISLLTTVLLSLLSGLFAGLAEGLVNPIEIHEQHFFDSITGELFFIKGVDYQPGGSSAITSDQDPLSNPKVCARDIALFQQLGINTIRVYSISPDLNHDSCMSMLAAAGMYLILDVNSPMENQHLNRYEPWTTYNHEYLQHVFEIIEEFGHYNNTLGFFAGNEIINDEVSAERSPVYVKAVVNDMKQYIKANAPRKIPVGYSAADDLRYRIPLSKYLECEDEDMPDSSIDFYGVNSYQWCGKQTFQTSGYDQLVKAYLDYTKPVFFSEFGCNQVSPRSFEEVESLHSKDMVNTFSGGLVYEFTQEANKYGLVEIDTNGDAHLLSDFKALQKRYTAIESKEFQTVRENAISLMAMAPQPVCESSYENLDITSTVPKNLAQELIRKRVENKRGKYIKLSQSDMVSTFDVYDENGDLFESELAIKTINQIDSDDVDDKHEFEPEDPSPPKSPSKERERNSAPKPTSNVYLITAWFASYLFLVACSQATVFNI